MNNNQFDSVMEEISSIHRKLDVLLARPRQSQSSPSKSSPGEPDCSGLGSAMRVKETQAATFGSREIIFNQMCHVETATNCSGNCGKAIHPGDRNVWWAPAPHYLNFHEHCFKDA